MGKVVVSIVMGSDSDLPVMQEAANMLEQFNVGYELDIVSAHRTPEKLFEFSSAGYGNIIFLVIALWAGSRASFSIMRITNYTMTGGQSTGRNYFVERIRSIRTMIVTIITVVFAIVILVYGELILEMVLGLLKIDAAKYEDSIWMWLRWPC